MEKQRGSNGINDISKLYILEWYNLPVLPTIDDGFGLFIITLSIPWPQQSGATLPAWDPWLLHHSFNKLKYVGEWSVLVLQSICHLLGSSKWSGKEKFWNLKHHRKPLDTAMNYWQIRSSEMTWSRALLSNLTRPCKISVFQ